MSEINIGDYIEFFIDSSQLDMPGKGDLEEAVHWAVEKAYGDAKRTMTGIGKFSNKRDSALKRMKDEFGKYFGDLGEQDDFDAEHKKCVRFGLVRLEMPI